MHNFICLHISKFFAAMFTVFLIYLALFSLIYLGGYAWRKIRRKLKTKTVDEAPPKKERVKSLDCFRGYACLEKIPSCPANK